MKAAFLLDSDSIEVKGLPTDEVDHRRMVVGSMRLLCALNLARGLPPPERPHGPPATFAPLPHALVDKYTRPAPIRKPARPAPIRGESKGRSVVRSVAEAYDLTFSEIIGKGRARRLVCARIVASRLLRDLKWQDGSARFSLPQIGRIMGRDHSTVCYHLGVFDAYCRLYPFMREAYEALGDGKR